MSAWELGIGVLIKSLWWIIPLIGYWVFMMIVERR